MLNIARFNVGDTVKIVHNTKDEQYSYVGVVATVKSVEYKKGIFTYRLDCDCGFFEWEEFTLDKEDKALEDLKPILKDENQLQREDSNLRSGERVQGSRVHGRKSQASIRSRPLGDPSRIRGK
jgi:MoaA/NifB/PqqE/SkfB family radical SAM enzyme